MAICCYYDLVTAAHLANYVSFIFTTTCTGIFGHYNRKLFYLLLIAVHKMPTDRGRGKEGVEEGVKEGKKEGEKEGVICTAAVAFIAAHKAINPKERRPRSRSGSGSPIPNTQTVKDRSQWAMGDGQGSKAKAKALLTNRANARCHSLIVGAGHFQGISGHVEPPKNPHTHNPKTP